MAFEWMEYDTHKVWPTARPNTHVKNEKPELGENWRLKRRIIIIIIIIFTFHIQTSIRHSIISNNRKRKIISFSFSGCALVVGHFSSSATTAMTKIHRSIFVHSNGTKNGYLFSFVLHDDDGHFGFFGWEVCGEGAKMMPEKVNRMYVTSRVEAQMFNWMFSDFFFIFRSRSSTTTTTSPSFSSCRGEWNVRSVSSPTLYLSVDG